MQITGLMRIFQKEEVETKSRLAGLDIVRIFALALILYQHFSSNFELFGLPVNFFGVNAGQAGVALFCGLSGFLAIQSSKRVPIWLFQRALRIFPAYWLQLFAAIIGNYIVKYKVTSIHDIVIQFLGFSSFIEPSHRLNVATWFITLLIVCYILAALILALDITNRRIMILCFLSLATLYLVFLGWHVGFTRQILAFEAGMLFSIDAGKNKGTRLKFVVIFVFLVLSMIEINCSYALISAVALILSSKAYLRKLPWALSWIARYSYEIFLTHGMFLVLFAKVLHWNAFSTVVVATLCTLFSSTLLKIVSDRVSGNMYSLYCDEPSRRNGFSK